MRRAVPLVWLTACYSPELPSGDGGAGVSDAAAGGDALGGDVIGGDASGGDATVLCLISPDGTPCQSAAGDPGQCRESACCTGCWDGVACIPGTEREDCGRAGGDCVACEGTCECDLALCPSEGDTFTGADCVEGTCMPVAASCCGPGGDYVCSATIADVCKPDLGCM
jgi:hypothetical protein